jgi:hypothetical protein
MFYLIKGIKRIITDYVISSELSKLILELENKNNILDNESDFKFKIAKIFEEYDTKTKIYSNQNLVVTYRKILEEKLVVNSTDTNTNTDTDTDLKTSTDTDTNTNTDLKINTELKTVNINKKKTKHYNKFRKMSIQQNKTICFICGRDTHKQNECTEITDIYGTII